MYSVEEDVLNLEYRCRRIKDNLVRIQLGDYSPIPKSVVTVEMAIEEDPDTLIENIKKAVNEVRESYSESVVEIDYDRYINVVGKGSPSEARKEEYRELLKMNLEALRSKLETLKSSSGSSVDKVKEERYKEYLKLKEEFGND